MIQVSKRWYECTTGDEGVGETWGSSYIYYISPRYHNHNDKFEYVRTYLPKFFPPDTPYQHNMVFKVVVVRVVMALKILFPKSGWVHYLGKRKKN